jgi:hypothetical protein
MMIAAAESMMMTLSSIWEGAGGMRPTTDGLRKFSPETSVAPHLFNSMLSFDYIRRNLPKVFQMLRYSGVEFL